MKRLLLLFLLLFALLLTSCAPLFEGNTGTTNNGGAVADPDAEPNTGTTGVPEHEDTPEPTPEPEPPKNPPLDDGFPNAPEDEGTKRY